MNKTLLLVVVIFTVLLGSGCAKKCTDCGKLEKSADVTRMFHQYEVIPEYSYYANLPDHNPPEAIAGIDRKYTVRSKYWKPVDLTGKQLEGWVNWARRDHNMYDDYWNITIDYRGSKILDPSGVQIGVYYSKLQWTILKFPEDNVIELSRPQPALIQRNARMGFSWVIETSSLNEPLVAQYLIGMQAVP